MKLISDNTALKRTFESTFKTTITIACLSTILMSSTSFAQKIDYLPSAWNKDIAGKPTQVLVLGTPHLSTYGDKFKSAMLTSTLDKLAAFKPDIITIEALSGEQCEAVKQFSATYADVYESYCRSTDAAEKATGLTVRTALEEMNKILKEWKAEPKADRAPTERRHLAAVFLAANDRASALVQWLRLPESERKIGDGIDEALLKILKREKPSPNENYDLAAVLASKLGLERVYATDDHTADSIATLTDAQYGPSIQAHWKTIDIPETKAEAAIKNKLEKSQDLLEMYRFHNNYSNLHAFIKADFGGALKEASAAHYGRQYVAWWETRNLRMIANIRSTFATQPGARVLSIVGSSHKPYFDAYLHMMHEVKVVDAEAVLK
jgi:hypothetical protein